MKLHKKHLTSERCVAIEGTILTKQCRLLSTYPNATRSMVIRKMVTSPQLGAGYRRPADGDGRDIA